MYRVFEALDQLVTILEEARGVPMTAGCVVPRGDVLDLLDDIRDALPGEVDDAQDVLDHRARLLEEAREEAEHAGAQARTEAEKLLGEARDRGQQLLAEAAHEAERAVAAGRREYQELTDRAAAEADRLVANGRAQQTRLVSAAEVVTAARAESARILDAAAAEADRLRAECDAYVDGTLAEFSDVLQRALQTVNRGRSHLRGSILPVGSHGGSALIDFDG